jgi:hypothetical protein
MISFKPDTEKSMYKKTQIILVALSLTLPFNVWGKTTQDLSKEESTKLNSELKRINFHGAMEKLAGHADLNNQDLKDVIIMPRKEEDKLSIVSIKSADLKKNFKAGQYLETKSLGSFTLASDGQFDKFEKPIVEDFDGDGKTDIGNLVSGKNLGTGKPMFVVYVLLQDTDNTFTKVPVITLDKKPASDTDVSEAVKLHLGKSVK